MTLPRVRFTVRATMVMIAGIPISWCLLIGVSNLIASIDHARLESDFRKGALIWETKQEAGRAASSRGYAEEQARYKRESLSRGLTALGLIGLGGALGGIGLAVRARYGTESSGRPSRVNALAAICSVGARLMFSSLIIAGVIYFGILLLVMAGHD